jgi:hypothetical protein
MVIRVLSVPDYLDLPTFDEVFRTILGWDEMGFTSAFTDKEYNSFRRRARSKTLCDFQLRRQEKFLYTCGAIDLWEREVRVLDSERGSDGDQAPICLGGRGAAPPEYCGGPTGYRADVEAAERRQIHVHACTGRGCHRNHFGIRSGRAGSGS